jgi:hypothetical protein
MLAVSLSWGKFRKYLSGKQFRTPRDPAIGFLEKITLPLQEVIAPKIPLGETIPNSPRSGDRYLSFLEKITLPLQEVIAPLYNLYLRKA